MKINKIFLAVNYFSFKYFFDKLIAFLLLILISPFLLFISLLILIILGKPIFFIQERPGFKCRPFKIIKFRTMKNLYAEKGDLMDDKFRIHKFGQFLRSTSIDELPALINIIKGEMSFIGPRPLLMKYLQLYNKEQIKRHYVKPGMTGLAQINGRNLISWEKKFQYDLYYVKKINFILDLKILIITFKKVFLRIGINSKNKFSANEFNGNN